MRSRFDYVISKTHNREINTTSLCRVLRANIFREGACLISLRDNETHSFGVRVNEIIPMIAESFSCCVVEEISFSAKNFLPRFVFWKKDLSQVMRLFPAAVVIVE
jgi:hypothetical protein